MCFLERNVMYFMCMCIAFGFIVSNSHSISGMLLHIEFSFTYTFFQISSRVQCNY